MLRRAPPAPARPTRQAKGARPPAILSAGQGLLAGVQQFLYDTRTELRKVVWPTREQATNLTGLVIAVAVAVAAFVGVVDAIFQKFFQLLIGG
jgi:preprotein translocase SecE subunit